MNYCPWLDDNLNAANYPGVPKGTPGKPRLETYFIHDGSKAARMLGLKYSTLLETARDTLDSFKARFPEDLA